MSKKIVIIGGVEAGLGAATQLRRNSSEFEITVFEKTEYISYGLCAMPFYINGIIEETDDFILYQPSYFKKNRNIDVLINQYVQKIDVENKEVVVKDIKSGELKNHRYDKLLIGTGAKARRLNVEGSDLKNIFTFRDIKSALALKEFIKNKKPKTCAVIGSGLIGLELVEAFVENGIKTYVVEKENHIIPNFSKSMVTIVEKRLNEKGVEVITGESVDAFLGNEKVEKISVGGKLIDVDFVLLSIGVEPEVEIAKSAGIEINSLGAIKVNNKMQTSVPHIYAAGDCTHSYSCITGKDIYMPLAPITDKQAQIAADNMSDIPRIYKGTVGTIVEKVFGLEIARTGLTESQIIAENYSSSEINIKSKSKAHYYPGSKTISLKVFINNNDRKILGAEMIGEEGVAKRIDVLGTAIYAGLKIDDLYDIDFAYTPPVAPSRDILWSVAARARG